MAEIPAEQRERAKAAAANAAVAANDTAVVLGAAGAVVVFGGVASGVGALAGVGVGAVLAVGSFGAWWVGNRYQRLANDPPRDDFDHFLTSAAAVDNGAVTAAEPEATAVRFAAQQMVLADALAALVTAIERHDGALAAGDAAAASAQADAALSNAQAAIAAAGILGGLAVGLNAAWVLTIPTVDWDSVSLAQAQDLLSTSVGTAAAPGQPLTDVFDLISDRTDTPDDVADHPLASAAKMPAKPSVLVSGSFVAAMAAVATELATLVIPDNA